MAKIIIYHAAMEYAVKIYCLSLKDSFKLRQPTRPVQFISNKMDDFILLFLPWSL